MNAKINVLFPTDFSDSAANALKYALDFIDEFNVRLILLHINKAPLVDVGVPAYEVIEEIEKKSLQVQKKIEATYNFVQEIQPGIDAIYSLENGDPAKEILKFIKEENIDLVIVGSKGRNYINSWLFGSVTTELIEKCTCPVLVVPSKASFRGVKKIVYASNFLDKDIDKINHLTSIAKAFEASISILHVSDEEENERNFWLQKFEDMVRKNVSYQDLSFIAVKGEDIVKTIESYAKTNKADMLVMNTRKRIPFEKLYNHSLTEKLTYHLELPLLVFHNDGL